MFFAASLVGDLKSAQKACTSRLENLIIGPDDNRWARASHIHAAAFLRTSTPVKCGQLIFRREILTRHNDCAHSSGRY